MCTQRSRSRQNFGWWNVYLNAELHTLASVATKLIFRKPNPSRLRKSLRMFVCLLFFKRGIDSNAVFRDDSVNSNGRPLQIKWGVTEILSRKGLQYRDVISTD